MVSNETYLLDLREADVMTGIGVFCQRALRSLSARSGLSVGREYDEHA